MQQLNYLVWVFCTLLELKVTKFLFYKILGNLTRGQVVIDHLNKNLKNIIIVEQVDVEKCKQMFAWTAEYDHNTSFD